MHGTIKKSYYCLLHQKNVELVEGCENANPKRSPKIACTKTNTKFIQNTIKQDKLISVPISLYLSVFSSL